MPLLDSVPMPANQPLPRMMIGGTFAQVSTLLMQVGWPHNPASDGYGGRGRGSPALPSMEAIRAVSSPQTKAPCPLTTSIWKSKPEPKIFLPSMPDPVSLTDRLLESGHGQWVLGAHVDDPALGTDGIAADDHPLETVCGSPSRTLRSM